MNSAVGCVGHFQVWGFYCSHKYSAANAWACVFPVHVQRFL